MFCDNNESGYLELFIGPMWSGKTSELIKIHKKYSFINTNITSINYIEDNVQKIISHDNIEIACASFKYLREYSDILNNKLTNDFINNKIFLINEAQFFEDIVEWVICAVETHKKKIYLCGLDGDYLRVKFGKWLDLIPFCDKVTKLNSICGICKKNYAIFTKRISEEKQQQILGSNNYIPVCRICYSLNI
tara:strand:- start:742 stop:1314 length:573 start_codon:yes stop_codon:yes gene_type:complete